MSEIETLPAIPVTADEVTILADYQAFLTRHGLYRTLVCQQCGQQAECGTGQTGWRCPCRILVWRIM